MHLCVIIIALDFERYYEQMWVS